MLHLNDDTRQAQYVHMTRDLTAIIFSKNRALQVDGLLRSIKDHWTIPLKETVIVARATSKRFADGYKEVIRRSPGTTWFSEDQHGGFRSCYEAVINKLGPNDDVVFWTDDDIVYQPLLQGPEVYAEWDPERHLFLSTRLDRTFKLAAQVGVPEERRVPPHFKSAVASPFLEWLWRDAPCSPWSYAFSVEGTIYSADFLKRMHSEIHYKAPNTYECEGVNWCNHTQGVPLEALSPLRACTFGNNVNITQTEWHTPHGNLWSMDRFNTEFLDHGKVLNLQWFYDHAQDITDCHHIIESEEILTDYNP